MSHRPLRSNGPSMDTTAAGGISSSRHSSSRTSSLIDGVDLESHRVPELRASMQDRLDRLQEVLVLVVELEVGVAGHPERHPVQELHPGEEPVEVGGDHLLEGNEPEPVGQRHEPREERRDLDAGEALPARLGVADDDRQVQRQVRDIRKRVRRVDRQRGEDRVHVLLERRLQLAAVGVVEVVPALEADPRLLEPGRDVLGEDRGLTLDEGSHLLADGADRLERVEAVRRPGADARRDLLLQTRDANLEELVEVHREDGQELGPFEQRTCRILGEREHPRVEVEPGELAVQKAVGVPIVTADGKGRPARDGHASHRSGGSLGSSGRIDDVYQQVTRR